MVVPDATVVWWWVAMLILKGHTRRRLVQCWWWAFMRSTFDFSQVRTENGRIVAWILSRQSCLCVISINVGGQFVYASIFRGTDPVENIDRNIFIYTTKIGTFVCPPHISETVAVRIMKFAHRRRIASTTNKLISKQILLSILSIIFNTI